MRDADAEPAEPTAAVVPGASRTSSMPSSVRATCRITFVTPCPTSAAAQCTSAEPSSKRRTRAAQESSKPSEYARFLKPTAKPTPRFTPSPRVVGFAVGFKNLANSEGFDDSCAARVRLFDDG